MIKLYKSHFSIGNSILRIPQIFSLEENEIVLVEDSMSGFRTAKKESEKTGKDLRFGLRLETIDSGESSKVIYFAEDSQGVDSLRRIYTKAFTTNNGIYKLDVDELKGIQVAIPFYDSYIHKNLHNFGSHELDFRGMKLIYFEENNSHPFDFFISKALKDLNIETIEAKSIYYEKKEDFPAFQFYKAVCNRKGGKNPTYERPELEYFCSDEFCLEMA